MNATAEAPTMAEKPQGKRKERLSVKIDPDVYRLVKTAAAWLDEDISDYLSRVVRPIAQRDVDRICRDSRKGGACEAE